ncbi:MAG: prolyl oligopeptidase family serine peptidase [bacterium]
MARFHKSFLTSLIFCFSILQNSFPQSLLEQAKRPVQLEDLFSWKQLTEIRLSPLEEAGEKLVAFVVRQASSEENRWISQIWLVFTKPGSKAWQITRNPKGAFSPRWSPDGQWLAFLAIRGEKEKAKAQIHLVPRLGGEPEQITEHPSGISSFDWSHDGKYFYFLAKDPLSEAERKRIEKKDDAKEVEKKFQYAHLYTLDIQTHTRRRITEGPYHIFEFELSPDGRTLAFAAAPTPLLNYIDKSELYTVSVNGGPLQRLTNNNGMESQLKWSPDGKWITFVLDATSDGVYRYVAPSRLFAVAAAGGEPILLTGNIKTGLSFYGDYFWDPRGHYIDLLINAGVKNRAVRLNIHQKNGALIPGKYRVLYEDNGILGHWDHDPEGKWAAYSFQAPQHPPEVFFGRLEKLSQARQLTDLNPQIKTLELTKHTVLHWTSPDGQDVEGILYYPLHYEPGKVVPLIVDIHGGPFSADRLVFEMNYGSPVHLYAAHGYATLMVNYRGSSSYGEEFGRAIVGHYYEYDVMDILAGVDHLVNIGIVDSNHLGIKGWSNGGILTAWITTETDRFKAAVPGAGDVNWISDFGNADIAVPFDREYFGGRPWENLSHYIEKSPIFRMKNVKTPTLILFGENDVRVPIGQGYEHFRALKELGKTVEFVVFPREGHGLREITHQRTKVQKELAWFDKYVLDVKERPQPLAGPLLERVLQVNGLYGKLVNGVLVPETVRVTADTLVLPLPQPTNSHAADTLFVQSVEIGRFEVTNAQYQFFLQDNPQVPVPTSDAPYDVPSAWNMKTRKFKKGYGNHPVVGVTAEEAMLYCQWLSEKTGKTYRLMRSHEWVYAACCGKHQTFPWGSKFEMGKSNSASEWAGETLFQARKFFNSEKGKKLLNQRALTSQVGHYPATDWKIYDLSGNVWEICSTYGNTFVARGGAWSSSAEELRTDYVLEIKTNTRRNDVGFRIVLQ